MHHHLRLESSCSLDHGDLFSQLLRPPYELCLNEGPDRGNGTPLGKKPVEVADKSGAKMGLTFRNCVWPELLASPAAKNINMKMKMKTNFMKTSSSASNVVGLLVFISQELYARNKVNNK